MWTRAMLKENAKYSMQRNYWYCIAALMGFMAIAGSTSRIGGLYYNITALPQMMAAETGYFTGGNAPDSAYVAAMVAGMMGAVMIFMGLTMLVKIFLVNPIQVGLRKFFIMNRTSVRTDVSYLVYPLKRGYGNVVKGMFLTHLFLMFWYALCIVPGIIKGFSYMLVPYILADNPDMDAMDAINLSKKMMDGHKAEAFVLGLSFIGWFILIS